MDVVDVLENNHQLVIRSVEDLPESEWEVPGTCGEWSVKDVLAHLTAYELVLIDVLNTFLGEQPTPYVLGLVDQREDFNRTTVQSRRYHTAQQVLTEYQDAQVQSTSLLTRIPAESVSQKGTMAWYKADLSLEDYIKRLSHHVSSHCEQIVSFHNKKLPEE